MGLLLFRRPAILVGGYRLSGFISDHKFLTLLSGVATFGSYGKIKNHND